MSRINTNVVSLIAQYPLQRSNADLQLPRQRLSADLTINHGVDNPAGIIVSECLCREAAGLR